MTIDLSPLWQVAMPLASAAAASSGAVLLAFLARTLHLKAKSQAMQDLDIALEHGIAFATDALRSVDAHNQSVTVQPGWLGEAAELVAKLAPAAISILGLTPAEIQKLIAAHVGPAKPSTSARIAPAPTTPAAPGDAATKPTPPTPAA